MNRKPRGQDLSTYIPQLYFLSKMWFSQLSNPIVVTIEIQIGPRLVNKQAQVTSVANMFTTNP